MPVSGGDQGLAHAEKLSFAMDPLHLSRMQRIRREMNVHTEKSIYNLVLFFFFLNDEKNPSTELLRTDGTWLNDSQAG